VDSIQAQSLPFRRLCHLFSSPSCYTQTLRVFVDPNSSPHSNSNSFPHPTLSPQSKILCNLQLSFSWNRLKCDCTFRILKVIQQICTKYKSLSENRVFKPEPWCQYLQNFSLSSRRNLVSHHTIQAQKIGKRYYWQRVFSIITKRRPALHEFAKYLLALNSSDSP
jgi:hypothetical protein